MRKESDSLGEVAIPNDALYGAQTQRAVNNFTISTRAMPALFIRSLAHIKCAAARANQRCGVLDAQRAAAIEQVALAVAEDPDMQQFPRASPANGLRYQYQHEYERGARGAGESQRRDRHPPQRSRELQPEQ